MHLTPVRAGGAPPAVVVIAAARWADVPVEAVSTLTEVARARPVYYVEPPLAVGAARLAVISAEPSGPVERVWLAVPGIGEVAFDDVRAADYPALLATWLHHRRAEHRDVWLCERSAHELAIALLPGRLVLDPPVRCCAKASGPSDGDLAPAAAGL
ncbi:MAG TPA: hypothetical protein VNA14_10170 [Mycobacteriales bacterium]|nr:hypothetical protein [Mycobacteriales bacterium]